MADGFELFRPLNPERYWLALVYAPEKRCIPVWVSVNELMGGGFEADAHPVEAPIDYASTDPKRTFRTDIEAANGAVREWGSRFSERWLKAHPYRP